MNDGTMEKNKNTSVQAMSPITLLIDGSSDFAYDFTDRSMMEVSHSSNCISVVHDLSRKYFLSVSSASTAPTVDEENGRSFLKSVRPLDSLTTDISKAIIPREGDFVLAWSHRSDETGPKVCIWQQRAGAEGRVQITANARWTGSVVAAANNYLQVFIGGATEGSGPSGMILAAYHPIGSWSDFVLILREGSCKSEFWCNGALVDTFTRPDSIPDVQTTFFRHPEQTGSTCGASMGRMLCLRRAPKSGDFDSIRRWIREGFEDFGTLYTKRSSGDLVVGAQSVLLQKQGLGEFGPVEIWSKFANRKLRPASMTKLVTAYVGLYWLRKLGAMNTLFTRSHIDRSGGSGSNLKVGDTIDVPNALANLGLSSSNVTANVWARVIGELILAEEGATTGSGYERFMRAVNDESKALGFIDSYWTNPSGLDEEGHLSTARDIAKLCAVADEEFGQFAEIWGKATWPLVITGPNARSFTIKHSVKYIVNGNERITWAKTGTTNQGLNCLLMKIYAPNGSHYFYVAFASPTDACRYSDADAVLSKTEACVN
jgi:hypothetical protein